MKLLVIFIIANIVNVALQTVKSLLTVKGNKWVASIANALAYGLYTWIVVLMVCELDLWAKMLIVGLCNLVGVFIVKLIEEKTSKNKLWKVEIAIPYNYEDKFRSVVENAHVSHNMQTIDNYAVFNCYCANRKQTYTMIESAKECKGKYSAYESKCF